MSNDKNTEKFITLLKALNRKKSLDGPKGTEFVLKHVQKHYPGETNLRNVVRKEMETLSPENFKEVFYLIDNIYPKIYSNSSTRDNNFTKDVRKIISNRFGIGSKEHELAKEMVALTYEEKGKLLAEQRAKAIEKNKTPIETQRKFIIEIIKDNIVSEDPFRKAVALLAASGSRPVELFVRSPYTEYNDEHTLDGHWVKQDKIAKKRGRDVSVIKPIIYITAKQFIQEVEYVRTKLTERYKTLVNPKEPDQLKTSIGDRSNKIAQQIFSSYGLEGLTLYASRKFYVNLSYDLFARNRKTVHGNKIPPSLWLSFMLGHEGKTGSLNNYTHVAFESETEVPEDMIARQNLLEAKVDELEARVEEKQVPQLEAKPLKTLSASEAAIEKLKPIFNDYIKSQSRKPSQAIFEKLTKNILPRATVRLAYKQLYKESK